MNKRRRNILLFLLLFLAAAGIWYFYPAKKKGPLKGFVEQGATEVEAGRLILRVWDYYVEDGDMVQVYFNGELLQDSLEILNKPVEYKLGKLKKGEYWVGIKAISEGGSSPASAYISVSADKADTTGTTREFSMDAWVDSAASWKLIVK